MRMLSVWVFLVLTALHSVAEPYFDYQGELSQFYKIYAVNNPRHMLFDDVIHLKLKLPEERGENYISDVERIHREDYEWQKALAIAGKIQTLEDSDYNEAVEHIINEYINDDENRPAIQYFVNAMMWDMQNPHELRKHVNKMESLIPHFEKGAARYTWVTALAWAAIGRGSLGPKVSTLVPGRLKKIESLNRATGKLKKVRQSVTNGRQEFGRRVTLAKQELEDDFVYNFLASPFRFGRWLLFKKTGGLREFPRDVGALTLMAGGTGFAYGIPAFMMYNNGSRLNPQEILDHQAYGFLAAKLTCDVLDFEKKSGDFNVESLTSKSDIDQTNKIRVAINTLVDNFNTIVDSATIYLNTRAIGPEVLNNKGHFSYKNTQSFYCEALKDHSGPMTVNLKNTRKRLRAAIDKVVDEIDQHKVNDTMLPLRDFISQKGGFSVGTINSLKVAETYASPWLKVKRKEDFEDLAIKASQFLIDESSSVPPEWTANIEEFLNTIPETPDMDKLSLAVDRFISSAENSDKFNFMISKLLRAGMMKTDSMAAFFIVSSAIHLKLNEFKFMDASFNKYLDPMKFIYFLVDTPLDYKSPIEIELDQLIQERLMLEKEQKAPVKSQRVEPGNKEEQ